MENVLIDWLSVFLNLKKLLRSGQTLPFSRCLNTSTWHWTKNCSKPWSRLQERLHLDQSNIHLSKDLFSELVKTSKDIARRIYRLLLNTWLVCSRLRNAHGESGADEKGQERRTTGISCSLSLASLNSSPHSLIWEGEFQWETTGKESVLMYITSSFSNVGTIQYVSWSSR